MCVRIWQSLLLLLLLLLLLPEWLTACDDNQPIFVKKPQSCKVS